MLYCPARQDGDLELPWDNMPHVVRFRLGSIAGKALGPSLDALDIPRSVFEVNECINLVLSRKAAACTNQAGPS